jgi:hypothetical protein
VGGQNSGGLFQGTSGSRKTMDIFKGANLQNSKSGGLGGRNTIRDNLHEMMQIVPLKRTGYFGEKSLKKKSHKVRVVICSDPSRTAYDFQSKAIKGFSSMKIIEGKGYVAKLRDGTTITYRKTSTSDGTPVVELTIKGLKRVKDQKIHFIKGEI